MNGAVCILNKSYLLTLHKDNMFASNTLPLMGDNSIIWCIYDNTIYNIVSHGFDLTDIHPNLQGLTLHNEIGFCYFMLGRNTTTTGTNENNQYKPATYKHQDISKLISEGIFIEDNHPRSVF